MTRIAWTPQAIQDVEAIRAYIGRDSIRYATRIAEQILEAVERLAEFPLSGRVVPELQDDAVREVLLGNFRMVYRTDVDEVQILTVFHAARQFTVPESDGD